MQQSRGKLKVSNVEFEGRYTLGNKLQRHVAATNPTCVLKNFCENLCLSNRILLLQPDQTEFVRLVAATKFCCRNKAFLTNLSFTRRDMLLRDYMDRLVTSPKRVASPIWGPPPPGEQALNVVIYYLGAKTIRTCFPVPSP